MLRTSKCVTYLVGKVLNVILTRISFPIWFCLVYLLVRSFACELWTCVGACLEGGVDLAVILLKCCEVLPCLPLFVLRLR